MAQPDPQMNFRMPSAMRAVATMVVEVEEYGDLSDLMRKTLQDRLYTAIGKILVKRLTWDGVVRLLHDCLAVPRVDFPMPVKSSPKG